MATRIESWLQGLQADAHSIVGGIAAALGRTRSEIDKEEGLLRQVLAHMAAQGRVPTGAGTGGQLPITLTVNLPISPATLTEMLLAGDKTQPLGAGGLFSFSSTVTAGGTTTVTIPNPTATVILFTSPLDITASYYDTGILMYATVDGKSITSAAGTTFDYQLAAARSIKSVLYSYVQANVELVITNNTGADVTITFNLENFTMDQDAWRQYWLPLIRGGVAAAQRIAGMVS